MVGHRRAWQPTALAPWGVAFGVFPGVGLALGGQGVWLAAHLGAQGGGLAGGGVGKGRWQLCGGQGECPPTVEQFYELAPLRTRRWRTLEPKMSPSMVR